MEIVTSAGLAASVLQLCSSVSNLMKFLNFKKYRAERKELLAQRDSLNEKVNRTIRTVEHLSSKQESSLRDILKELTEVLLRAVSMCEFYKEGGSASSKAMAKIGVKIDSLLNDLDRIVLLDIQSMLKNAENRSKSTSEVSATSLGFSNTALPDIRRLGAPVAFETSTIYSTDGNKTTLTRTTRYTWESGRSMADSNDDKDTRRLR